MVKVSIDYNGTKIEKELPESWKEVTVGQLMDISNIDMSDCEVMGEQLVKIVAYLMNVDEEVIDDIPVKQFTEITEVIKFIAQNVLPEEFADYVEIDGEKYYLRKNFNDIRTRETIMISTLTLDKEGNNIPPLQVLDKLLCFFLLKKDEDGNLEKFHKSFIERAQQFRNLPVEDVVGVVTFFFDGKKRSGRNTKKSLEAPK